MTMMQFQYLLHNIPRVENMLAGKPADEGNSTKSNSSFALMSSKKVSAIMKSKGIRVPE